MLAVLLTLFASAAPPLEVHVDPVQVPAVVEVPVENLVWADAMHDQGPAWVVAEILGDDLQHCDVLRSADGFKPAHAEELWSEGLLSHAVVEVTHEGVSVAGRLIVPLVDGQTPSHLKDGVVLRPLLQTLMAYRETQYQFRVACRDPAWKAGGVPTSASSERLLVAVAGDMPFDVVHEVLLTARKARFKTFYLYARGKRVVADPLAMPPSVGDAGARVFVASDGGLGIDYQDEGTDTPASLVTYLPRPAGTRSARVVPYGISPFAAVAGAAGALLDRGFEPAVLPRLDGDELRAGRQAPHPIQTRRSISGRRAVTAVPITLPEGSAEERRTVGNVTRFSITGATPHVAIFTPPVHLADALNTPAIGSQLKRVLTCYRDEQSGNAALEGELVLEVRVKPTGEAERVSFLPTSTLDDRHVRRCVVDEFMSLPYPQAAITPDPMLWKVNFLPRAPGIAAEEEEDG